MIDTAITASTASQKSDAELLRAMFYLWERMKTVIEPTGALGVAGLFERVAVPAGARVGVLVSGGNVDFAEVGRWIGLAGGKSE